MLVALFLPPPFTPLQARDSAVFEAVLAVGHSPGDSDEVRLLDRIYEAQSHGDLLFGQPEPKRMKLKPAERRGLLARNRNSESIRWFAPRSPSIKLFPRAEFKPYTDAWAYLWFLLPAYSADHRGAVVVMGSHCDVRYGYSYNWLKLVGGTWRVVRWEFNDLT
jgi:hypothetical protein